MRPSIAARPAASARRAARAFALAALALAAPAALAQVPAVQPPGQVGTPEPERPTKSVPYDGAIAAYRAGRSGEALAIAERALETDPRNPQLRFLRGVVLAEQGRTEVAIETFASLVQDFPELPEPYNNLAVIHASRGDWDRAREALEQAIRAVPTYALAHENLGDIHLQLAARAWEQAGRLDPRNASARSKLASARELILRLDAAPTDSRNPRPPGATEVTPR